MRKLFFGILVPLLFVACSDDDGGDVLVPQVSLTSGEVTEHSLSFSVIPANAEVCAYMCLEEGMAIPDAENVLSQGTKIAADKKSEIKLDELKAGISYNIVAAVANSNIKVLSETLKLTTAKEIIPEIAITAGTVGETSLSFLTKPINATSGAYVCLEADASMPSAEEIIAKGTAFDVKAESEVVVENLKAGTVYSIVAAVANKKNYAMSEVVEMKTLAPKVVFTSAEGEMYSGFADVTFKDAAGKYELQLDFNADFATSGYMPAGKYVVGSAEDFYIDIEAETTVLKSLADGKSFKLQSGHVTVSITEKKVYHIDIDVILAGGEKFVAEYEGDIKNMEVVYQLKPSEAQLHQINDAVPGEYYIFFHDSDWKWELYVDFFADPKSSALPAGTYKFASDKSKGTFGPQSNIQIYTPYSNNYIKGGEIEVKVDGETYTIVMKLVGDSGREMEGTYTGKISFDK